MRPSIPSRARRRRAFVLSGLRECRTGFTLVEIVVVLVLLGLAATLVAPALLFPPAGPTAALPDVIRQGREAAVTRGETLLLRLDGAGHWELLSAGGEIPAPLARGEVADSTGAAFALRLTPTGLCAPVPAPGTEQSAPALDPLDCGSTFP